MNHNPELTLPKLNLVGLSPRSIIKGMQLLEEN
jgi:hypothetical protein